ncbi:hypothetical protein Ahy_B05g073801 [Arachis hypogaea]|uniref:Uncharacterized protein n=1 Tax=Arachis hypogaea TaxID=3818 RepID=A0A444YX20_ARAHY|nr:hypothetical protein Ahy_B05g073801 [Arachis hypogaea]
MDEAEANTTVQALPEMMSANVEALLEAARYDDMDDVVILASNGVPLNSKDEQGRTALHMAAANGHIEIVEYLIGQDDDITVELFDHERDMELARGEARFQNGGKGKEKYGMCEEEGVMGNGILMLQTRKRIHLFTGLVSTDMLRQVLFQVVKKLIMAGANVGVLNSHERTPMDEAVTRGKLEVMDAINEAVALVELRCAMVSTQESSS